MSDHRAMLKDMVAKFFREVEDSLSTNMINAETFRTIWSEVSALGLPDVLVPEERGGFGGNWSDAGEVFQALGRFTLPLPIGENILARHWLDGLEARIPSGLGIFVFDRMSSRKLDAGHILSAPMADQVEWILSVSGDQWKLLSLSSSQIISNNQLDRQAEFLIPMEQLDALEQGSSAGISDRFFHQAALLRACQMAGAITAMLDMTIDHVQQREQFGAPLSKLQAVQQEVALLAEDQAAVSCAVASACQALTVGDATMEIAIAKWKANEASARASRIAHQLHGAIGITQEYPLHRYSQNATRWRSDFGNERYWLDRLAAFVLSNRDRPLWHMLTERSDTMLAAFTEQAS